MYSRRANQFLVNTNKHKMNNENYCNNCGKLGHYYHNCKNPIMSIGVIAHRKNKGMTEYLMIRRRDTLGYIDFLRGKYSVYNKDYIMNMLKQMTQEEKERLLQSDFNELWRGIWGVDAQMAGQYSKHLSTGTRTKSVLPNQYRNEEHISRDKFNALNNGITTQHAFYTLETLVLESQKYSNWNEPEWGFPKGRRNFQEKDYDCAMREFQEETGYDISKLYPIQNILPYEEIFTGSNYKSYKHKYFITYMNYEDTTVTNDFEPTEVSKMEWKSFEDCIACIRYYNLEKKKILTNIHTMLHGTKLRYSRTSGAFPSSANNVEI